MYYSTLDQVWGKESVMYERAHFDALFRDHPPTEYVATITAALDDNNAAADESQSSRASKDPEKQRRTWPVDVFGNDNSGAEIAHLIPAGVTTSATYDDAAARAVGFKERNGAVRCKLIHGSKPRSSSNQPFLPTTEVGPSVSSVQPLLPAVAPSPSSAHTFPSGEPAGLAVQPLQAIGPLSLYRGTSSTLSQQSRKSSRIKLTGMKHADCHKMRLNGQGTFLDRRPSCVLVILAMTKDDLLNWTDGKPYTAIVMVEGLSDPSTSAQTVDLNIGMGQYGAEVPVSSTEAPNAEIELARMRIKDVLLGLAYSLSQRPPEFIRRHNLFNFLGEITVPTVDGSQPEANRHVRKVQFGLAGLYPPPDPLLLAIRAALVWSRRNAQRLLAGGEEDEDDDNSSIESEELFEDRVARQPGSEDGAPLGDLLECPTPPTYIHVPLHAGLHQRERT